MSVTHCLGPFAVRLRSTPRAGWSALVAEQPEACPNGCGVACREVCREYARMQWRVSERRAAAEEHKRIKR